MKRKHLLDREGATRKSDFSWSAVNWDTRTVYFGAWKFEKVSSEGGTKIFGTDWKEKGGRINRNYTESLRNVELVTQAGFALKTFPQAGNWDQDGNVHLGEVDDILSECFLVWEGGEAFAIPVKTMAPLENGQPRTEQNETFEGEKYQVLVTGYERSPEARADCQAKYGFSCKICEIDFVKTYGDIGHGFIHVHHLVRVADRPKPYRINGAEELRPLCPNCHAMVHKRVPPYTINDIRIKMGKAELENP